MKPVGRLQRHKPLLGNPGTYRAWQERSRETAILRRRSTVLARAPQIRPAQPKDTGPDKATRDLIRTERAEHRCEVTGAWLGARSGQYHHRRPRRMGGDPRPDTNSPQNLLLLSAAAHDWVERNRAEAHRLGLLLHDRQDPLTTPVQLHQGRVLLDDHGGTTPAGHPEGEAA